MTPTTQRITADPHRTDGADHTGTPGDCLRAALATLHNLPYDQVPHVALHGRAWWPHLRRWARTHGHDYTRLPPHAAPALHTAHPGALLLARGPSPRGTRGGHVVVVDTTLDLVWDPHPSRAGLVRVDELIVTARPYWPGPPQLALTAG